MLRAIEFNNRFILLVNLILAEVFLAIISTDWVNLHSSNLWGVSTHMLAWMTSVVAITIGILAVYLLREVADLAKKEQEAHAAQILLEENKETMDALRAQRHDFMNHLQVISGLLSLSMADKCSEYIRQITNEMYVETQEIKVNNPILAALFLKKSTQAKAKKVEFITNVQSHFLDIPVSHHDLSRVVGNLLENAIYAASKGNDNPKKVEVSLSEDTYSYCIRVVNTGTPISEELKEQIFKRGFTTKGSEGTGYGLNIVQELVTRNSGMVILDVDEMNRTRFTVTFPKKK